MFVDAAAPNAKAVANAKSIVRGGKLVTKNKDADETILFGECRGSGRSVYAPSVDFQRSTQPVYRCTCPSRQFPCKHCLGLMYAWVLGEPFSVAEVPADVAQKRARSKERAEKGKASAAAPKKVNKRALVKKIDAQLDGLDVLERMTHDLIRSGFGSLNARTARMLEERAKYLGNAYLPGAQNALRSLTTLFVSPDAENDGELTASGREAIYSEALDRLTRLHMICRRGREYLSARKADPELRPDCETTIAEWLGHAWQLKELQQCGLFQENVELVQLYFCSYDDPARQEFVDLGAWINLSTGAVQLTQNYRPYRAAKFIREDDCFFHVKQVKTLYRYPGALNPRIRWEDATDRPLVPEDLETLRRHAHGEFADLLKRIKNQLKDPLAAKSPYALVAYRRLGQIGDRVVIEDDTQERLVLGDHPRLDPMATVPLLFLVDSSLQEDGVALLRFFADLDEHTLRAKPLTLVGDDHIVRLAL